MNPNAKRFQSLKKVTQIVYLCQLLSFFLAGLPLLMGVLLNFLNKDEVAGTWLASHFEWQIKTAWVALAGFALAGLTFELGWSVFILIPTIMLMTYRIVVGWNNLNADKPVKED